MYLIGYNQTNYSSISEFREILIHEVIHALIYRKFKYSCPLWMNEGLAILLSNQYKHFKFDFPLEFDYSNLSYTDDFFYQKCYLKTLNHINYLGKDLFWENLNNNFLEVF